MIPAETGSEKFEYEAILYQNLSFIIIIIITDIKRDFPEFSALFI
ncbi:protein of unknown function [Candidatus Nitrosocosmicus franklandus]|uniref:Uncharacterized protein n=1 Tax=Candidatus Nitrosocosmicus franklandianus TaxID=1798806 RepID=A0A484IBE0_9ARCH|nr:protein of unknown function [Candidatus Nitrosocosmicus franklandus]